MRGIDWNQRKLELHYLVVYISIIEVRFKRLNTKPIYQKYCVFLGVDEDFVKEILVFDPITEDVIDWEKVIEEFKIKRNVRSVGLFVTIESPGLTKAILTRYSSYYQLCVQDLHRQLSAYIKFSSAKNGADVKRDLKNLFYGRIENREHFYKELVGFCRKWNEVYPRLTDELLRKRLIFYTTFTELYPYLKDFVNKTRWIDNIGKYLVERWEKEKNQYSDENLPSFITSNIIKWTIEQHTVDIFCKEPSFYL